MTTQQKAYRGAIAYVAIPGAIFWALVFIARGWFIEGLLTLIITMLMMIHLALKDLYAVLAREIVPNPKVGLNQLSRPRRK